ncbi:MAG: alpha/beta hydrolase-fold protein [Nitriliruptorales bacterium]|nr:alpha/beta hydrolase-fold protein [Nitriliruptorales bacterium]
MRTKRRSLAILGPLVVASSLTVGAAIAAAPAAADARAFSDVPDELSPDEDNSDPAHREACEDVTSDAGSTVIRRLVDGPRLEDGSLAFVSGVCIYLPPGYADGTLRYPVLYLLHGAFGWQDDWVVQGDAQAVLDAAYEEDPDNAMIVVMPDGTYDANWEDDLDGYPLNETYVFDHLIPWVDRHLRTIPTRAGRAMAGLSNGGAGTLRLAALHPDHFAVVTAMSAALPVNQNTDPFDVRAYANDPTEMADNLNQTELALIWGLECGDPDACATYNFAWAFENACCNNEIYNQRLQQVGRTLPWQYIATVGAHDWFYWNKWLAENDGPYIRERLANPVRANEGVEPAPPPDGWSFRSLEREFSIYGIDVVVDPGRGDEFLRLTNVQSNAMTLTGSGLTTVTTARVGDPDTTWVVAGAGDGDALEIRADATGRLTFQVDLGPANDVDEYSPQQRASAAGGGWFTTRTVTFEQSTTGSVASDEQDTRPRALPATGGGMLVGVGLAMCLAGVLNRERRGLGRGWPSRGT